MIHLQACLVAVLCALPLGLIAPLGMAAELQVPGSGQGGARPQPALHAAAAQVVPAAAAQEQMDPAAGDKENPQETASTKATKGKDPGVGKPHVELGRLLRHIPDDAVFVLVIPDADRLVTHGESFGRAIGVDALAQLLFGRILQAVLGDSSDAIRGDTPLVMAISAAFVEPLVIAALEPDQRWKQTATTTPLRAAGIRYELASGQSFVAAGDVVALFGRDAIDVEAALDSSGRVGRAVEEACGPWLADSELLVYLDVPGARNTIGLFFGLIEQAMRAGMLATKADPEADFAAMQVVLGQTRQLVEDARDYVAAVAMNGEELRWRDRLRIRPDTATARYLGKLRPSTADLWRGLPNLPAAVWFAGEWLVPADETSANELLVRELMATPTIRDKIGHDEAEKLLQRSLRMHRMLSGQSTLFAHDPQRGCLTLGVHLTEKPDELRREIAEMAAHFPDTLGIFGVGASVELTHRIETVGGRMCDVFPLRITTPDTPTRELMTLLYGQNSTMILFDTTGGIGFVIGDEPAALEQAARSIADTTGFSKTPALKRLLARLSPDPQALMVCDMGMSLTLLLEILRASGVPMPQTTAPPNPQPLAGLALYMQADQLRIEAVIPASAVAETIRVFSALSSPPVDAAEDHAGAAPNPDPD